MIKTAQIYSLLFQIFFVVSVISCDDKKPIRSCEEAECVGTCVLNGHQGGYCEGSLCVCTDGVDTSTDPEIDSVADPDEEEYLIPDTGEDTIGEIVDVEVVDVNDVSEPEPDNCTIDLSGRTFPTTLSDGSGGARPIKLIIESVDFESDIVVISNVTETETINFTSDWRVYTHGSNASLEGASLAPGARLKIHLTDTGTNDADDFYAGTVTLRIEACGGEAAILYNSGGTGWSNYPEYVEAFVMWGIRNPMAASATFNDEAVDAGAWSVRFTESDFNVFVCWATGEQPYCGAGGPCSENDVGIIATGSVITPGGWTSVTADDTDCFFY